MAQKAASRQHSKITIELNKYLKKVEPCKLHKGMILYIAVIALDRIMMILTLCPPPVERYAFL